jgi:KAP family P-loop domain
VFAIGAVIVAGLSLLAGGLGAAGAGVAGAGVLGAAGAGLRAWTAATREALDRPLEGSFLRYVRQPDYAGKLGYLHLVEEDMIRALQLLTPNDQPAVIFIDDLDRCSPSKIAEVIEAVNLFLTGDYPNCAFVIGIDAEVVAASMEVVHSSIIDKLSNRRGELGWRFMDKFVQLPFVMPRLHPDQREAYLRGLFATTGSEGKEELNLELAQLESDVEGEALPIDELARRVGHLAPRLAAIDPDKARALGEKVVEAGAHAFSDSDPEVAQALVDQLRYLSDNPRTIKRAVNLYRFHRFVAFARQASTLPLAVATPEQIGRWIVVIIRWPHFVRWLQAQREAEGSPDEDLTAQVFAAAAKAGSSAEFRETLIQEGVNASWVDDVELWEFLHSESRPDLKLDLAGPRGLW